MTPFLIAALVIGGPPAVYFAVRSRDFRKFLAGAFFVSFGMQAYFYTADVPIPLIGTNAVQSPELSGARAMIHFVFFLLSFYFGFIWKRNDPSRQ
jgi:hypothetical protein